MIVLCFHDVIVFLFEARTKERVTKWFGSSCQSDVTAWMLGFQDVNGIGNFKMVVFLSIVVSFNDINCLRPTSRQMVCALFLECLSTGCSVKYDYNF